MTNSFLTLLNIPFSKGNLRGKKTTYQIITKKSSFLQRITYVCNLLQSTQANTMKFLLYGANGYTGQIIAEYAKQFGITPVLAGRSEHKIRPIAIKLGLDYRIFSLDDPREIDVAISDLPVVLHTAGPYSRTAKPMMEACIRTMTHYLDITGEIETFELAHSFDEDAKKAQIMLMSGTGFDVVPTDCVARYLTMKLPDATHLKLAFAGKGGGVSHGTAMTMAENLGQMGAERQNGKIVSVPVGHRTMYLPTGKKDLFAMSIPWGDVSTAYYSTGIPNIVTYMGIPPSSYKFVKLQKYFNWLLRTSFVKNMVKRKIDSNPAGPTLKQRKSGKTYVYGEVTNKKGVTRKVRLITPEAYELTALSSLIITKKVLNGNAPIGFQTPSAAYGADLVMEIKGVVREDL